MWWLLLRRFVLQKKILLSEIECMSGCPLSDFILKEGESWEDAYKENIDRSDGTLIIGSLRGSPYSPLSILSPSFYSPFDLPHPPSILSHPP